MGVPLLSLPELLAASDIVTLHATATEKGKPLLGRTELGWMKKGAILVNVARGSARGRGGARRSPLRADISPAPRSTSSSRSRRTRSDPLLKLPNVVATPHLGASTVEAQERVALQTIEGLVAALSGSSAVPGGQPSVPRPCRSDAARSPGCGWPSGRRGSSAELGAERVFGLAVETLGTCRRTCCARSLSPRCSGALEGHSPETVNFVNALHVAHERGLRSWRRGARTATTFGRSA